MDQATIEWLPIGDGNWGPWIGCNEEGKVFYKNDVLEAKWKSFDDKVVLKANRLIKAWADARKHLATVDPDVGSATRVKDFNAQATQAVNEVFDFSSTTPPPSATPVP